MNGNTDFEQNKIEYSKVELRPRSATCISITGKRRTKIKKGIATDYFFEKVGT